MGKRDIDWHGILIRDMGSDERRQEGDGAGGHTDRWMNKIVID